MDINEINRINQSILQKQQSTEKPKDTEYKGEVLIPKGVVSASELTGRLFVQKQEIEPDEFSYVNVDEIVKDNKNISPEAIDVVKQISHDLRFDEAKTKLLIQALENEEVEEYPDVFYQNLDNINHIEIDSFNRPNLHITINDNGTVSKERFIEDFANIDTKKHNPTQNIHYKATTDSSQLVSSEKEVRDHDGNLIYSEEYVPSEKWPGKHDIWRTDANGSKYNIGLVEITPNGITQIEKTLTSPAGNTIQYVQMEDMEGSRMSNIKITDKDGKVLTDYKQSFKKIDDNHYKSKENGISYDMQYFEDKVVVTNESTGEVIEIPIGENGVIKNTTEICKKIPGSVYFDISKNNLQSIHILETENEDTNGYYDDVNNMITFTRDLNNPAQDNMLLHELGHFRDFKMFNKQLSEDKNLIEIFNQERAEFLEHGTSQEIRFLDYFTMHSYDQEDEDSPINTPLEEVIAETNAYMYSENKDKDYNTRGELMFQYYPKTMAYVINKFTGQT